jgi:hypothetical protein
MIGGISADWGVSVGGGGTGVTMPIDTGLGDGGSVGGFGGRVFVVAAGVGTRTAAVFMAGGVGTEVRSITTVMEVPFSSRICSSESFSMGMEATPPEWAIDRKRHV